jgi:hypothetical protein
MSRIPTWLALGVVCVMTTTAAAEQSTSTSPTPGQGTAQTGRRTYVETPVEAFSTPTPHAISQTLYLERCKGGCTINKGTSNDARTNTSTIPTQPGAHSVTEYQNAAGQTGTAADTEWNAVVTCMKEVYSPYNVTVTDVKPTTGVSYHLALIAGNPGDIGLGNDILGIAPLAGDCSPQDNVISFSFANHHSAQDPQRVFNLCWTAAQESAHAFGLDHEFAFQDGSSSCRDPMTYRSDCGGQRFYRNEVATCGEFEARPCKCGGTQNSHLKIQAVFGPGMAITGNPTSNVTLPLPNTTLGAVVAAQAGSKRGIARVELFLNGFKWAEGKGAAFGANGQANPSTYTITVPNNVPNSIIDVQVRAFDDLGAFTDSAKVTVTKGAACTSADACAKGQKCEGGRGFWDQPAGEIGDACTYGQFCKSLLCDGTVEEQICTKECIPGVTDSCPENLECVMRSPGKGVCFFGADDSGCCSVNHESNGWMPGAFGALLFGVFVVLRPRRRAGR